MTRPFISFLMATLFAVCAAQYALAQRSWDGGNGTFVWSDFGNWNPDGTPAGEPITIGNLVANVTTILDQAFTIDSLTISAGADVDTTVNEVIVDGLTTIGGVGSSILVRPHTTSGQESLDTQGLTVNADGLLSLRGEVGSTDGGVVELESGLFQINANGEAGGHGTIELINAATVGQAMENSGRLFVSSRPGNIIGVVLPGTLTITNGVAGTGTIDLDGDGEAGIVDVDDGSIVINSTSLTLNIDVPLDDGFGGTMDIGNGDTVNITNAWTADSDGIINFNGTGTHTLTGGTLTVNGAATALNLNAGTTVFNSNLVVTDGDFTLATDAAVQFDGTTSFDDATDFTNGNNTTMTINSVVNIGVTAVAGEDFNWDGGGFLANQTTVNNAGDLNINAENIDIGTDDTYDATITMNSGNIDVQVSDAVWVMDGVLNISNTDANTPLLSGDTIEIGNDLTALSADVNIGGTGLSSISAPIVFQSDADVNVAPGAILQTGAVTFHSVNAASNASFAGTGTWRLTGLNTVSEATTINMTGGTVDLDNSSILLPLVGNDTNVNAPLTINAATMANYGSSGTFGDSELNVDSLGLETGSLTVNLDDPLAEWTVVAAGIVNLVNDNTPATLLAGSDVNMNGLLNITGDVRATARMDIGSGGVVNILTAAEPFRLSGGNTTNDPNTIAGGTVNGPGILGADNGSELSGFGTINAAIDFDVSSILQADNGTLTVNSTIIDVGVIGTQDADGILDVVLAWNSSVADLVDLQGGELRGGTITIDNANGITGFGLVSAPVVNNQRIRAQAPGQTLVVETGGNNNDWDGATNTGQLIAGTGNLEVRDNAAFLFRGTVDVGSGRQVFANGFELEFEPASTLSLTGGTYRSTNATDIGGTVTTGAGTSTLRIAGNTVFENGSNTTLIGDLQLDNAATRIDGGATFSGAGALVNIAGRTLTLADGADVDVLLQNDGQLVLGTSAGQTQGLEFSQSASGAWNVELGGTGLNDNDRMTLTGLASLAGSLNLSLIGGYVPTLLDPALTILSASNISGTFASVTQPLGIPAGLAFSVDYSNPGNVQLVIVPSLLGDYNNNGTVDAADYVLWRNGGPLQNDPTPGVQPADYDFWRAHFGQTAGSGSGTGFNAAVPEPSTFVLLLGALALPAVVRRLSWSNER